MTGATIPSFLRTAFMHAYNSPTTLSGTIKSVWGNSYSSSIQTILTFLGSVRNTRYILPNSSMHSTGANLPLSATLMPERQTTLKLQGQSTICFSTYILCASAISLGNPVCSETTAYFGGERKLSSDSCNDSSTATGRVSPRSMFSTYPSQKVVFRSSCTNACTTSDSSSIPVQKFASSRALAIFDGISKAEDSVSALFKGPEVPY